MNENYRRPVDVGGMRLEAPLMVGAGPVKLTEHVLEIARSAASAIVVGSITMEERSGNAGQAYYSDPQDRFTLNSKGLPNPGVAYYEKHLPAMVQIAHDHGKPLIVSVAGFSPQEYGRLAEAARRAGADGSELNLGCPNVWGKDGKQKRIVSFDQDLTGESLEQVEQRVGLDWWISAKLSPFSDPAGLESIADVLRKSQLLNAVTTTNAFPNAFAFNEDGAQAIGPAGGLGGMAGEALKVIGMGQVTQLRMFLPSTIAIIGVGGISKKADMEEYLRVGANAVQVTSAYINVGPSIFGQILS